MDKYEFRISLQEINQLIGEKRFDEAAGVADTIDWNRVRNPETLCRVSDVYKITRQYDKSRRVLMIAESRDPQNSEIIFSLCELTIFLYSRNGLEADLVSAYQMKQRYQQLNPGTAKSLILEYKLYKATNVSAGEKIGVLEKLKSVEYSARWGFELAKCYREAGELDKAAAECQSVISNFQGRYADRAGELLQEIHSGEALPKPQGETQNTPGIGDNNPQPQNTEFRQDPGEQTAASEEVPAGSRQETAAPMTEEAPGAPEAEESEAGSRAQEPAAVQTAEKISERPDAGRTDGGSLRPEADFGTPDQSVLGKPSEQTLNTAAADTEKMTAAAGAAELNPVNGDEQPSAENDGKEAEREETSDRKETEENGTPEKQPMTINEVVDEWVKIRDNIRAQNDRKRKERLLEDTGSLMDAFDETAKHSLLEDIERNVERQQREARQGYAYSELSDGLTEGERQRARQTADGRDQRSAAPEESYRESAVNQAEQGFQYVPAEPSPEEREPAYDAAAEQNGPAYEGSPEQGEPVYDVPAAAEQNETEYDAPAETAGETDETDYDGAAADTAAEQDAADWNVPLTEQGEQFNTMPQPYLRNELPEEQDSYSREPEPERFGTSQGEEPGTEGAAPGESEEGVNYIDLPEEYPRNGHSTRRWSASDVRRAMQLNKARLAEMEEADREALDYAVENAGKDEPAEKPEETAPTGSGAEEPAGTAGTEAAGEEREDAAPADMEPAVGTMTEPVSAGTEAEETTEAASAEVEAEEPEEDAAAEDGTDKEESGEAAADEAAPDEIPAAEVTEEAKAAEETEAAEEAETAEKTEETAPAQPAADQSEVPRTRRAAESFRQKRPEQRRAEERRPERKTQRPAGVTGNGADFSDDEKKLFGPIAYVKANRDQILAALDRISLAGDDGNVIITGAPAGADRCAKGLLHMVRHSDSNFSSEVAVASAEQMNRLDAARLSRALDKIGNGAIKITGAGALHKETLAALCNELENKERGVIVLLLDTRKAMDALLKAYPEYLKSFTARIDIHPLDDKALVAYGMEYALHQDYSIDELGQLALSTRISSLQTRVHHVSTGEVREIVDEAISYASRKSLQHFFAVLTHKRYDEDDRIIIHEKDFMHY